MRCLIIILFASLFNSGSSFCQPWKSPLKIAESSDGMIFSNDRIFQDSSGVPSLIRLPSGVLICAFQWFRQPVGSPSWDKVAVKFSSDNGITWSEPQPVNVSDLPSGFSRPFDPALSVNDSGKIRMFFSSGLNMILDTSINTYSAVSDDGVNYTMDSGVRFSLPDRPVIDPAVIRFNNLWHLVNPVTGGTGAYHNISNDGFNFTRVSDIQSDMNHSWIGNFLIKNVNELRFYGSGMGIWYSSSANGGVWSSFVQTNLTGGDPSVLSISGNVYMMIYTGPQYPLSIEDNPELTEGFILNQNFPNPFNPKTIIKIAISQEAVYAGSDIRLKIYNASGKNILTKEIRTADQESYEYEFDGSGFSSGIYFYALQINGILSDTKRMVLLK